jgi:hypothetical protein
MGAAEAPAVTVINAQTQAATLLVAIDMFMALISLAFRYIMRIDW